MKVCLCVKIPMEVFELSLCVLLNLLEVLLDQKFSVESLSYEKAVGHLKARATMYTLRCVCILE